MKKNPRPNPYGPEVLPEADGSPAIPLWIGGHAFLTMPGGGFFDIRGDDGQIIRRVPLCGGEAVDAAVAAARTAAATPWPAEHWPTIRAEIAALMHRYADHLEGLLRSEIGASANARGELTRFIEGEAERGAIMHRAAPQLVALVGIADEPFAAPARAALGLLAAGHVVILKPSVRAPSALLAFAEIATRAGLPAGRLNVVHGDEAVVEALCRHPDLARVDCVGDGEAAERIRGMAVAAGKLAGNAGP